MGYGYQKRRRKHWKEERCVEMNVDATAAGIQCNQYQIALVPVDYGEKVELKEIVAMC